MIFTSSLSLPSSFASSFCGASSSLCSSFFFFSFPFFFSGFPAFSPSSLTSSSSSTFASAWNFLSLLSGFPAFFCFGGALG